MGTVPVTAASGRIIPVDILDPMRLFENATVTLPDRFGGYTSLIISATLFASINLLSIVGIASAFESEDGIAWYAPRECTAQGTACLAAGLTGSGPVSGSMSRSLVSRMTGTTSRLACAVTAVLWIYCLPLMRVMRDTPKSALAAVIVSAVVKGVMKPKDLLRLGRGREGFVGWGTGLITALTSPTIGFGAGLGLYLMCYVAYGDNGGREKMKTGEKKKTA